MTTTPICSIDRNGIYRPTLQDCLDYINTAYKGIYGQDVYIDPDSQDGQFLGLLASVIDDCNSMAVSVYNAFSPSTAQGVGLSRVVKINGIVRKVPTNSTVDVVISGVVGTVITNGVVRDEIQGTLWDLPETVTIPDAGEIIVTATSQTAGDVSADPSAINTIATSVPGWQSVNNPEAAVPGDAVELDGELRIRQAISAALPAVSSLKGLNAAIAAISGVNRFKIYENPNPGVDTLGIPGHSIAAVVEGGDWQEIVDTIALKKGEGVNTYGVTTSLTTADEYGIKRPIAFTYPERVAITYILQVRTKPGFTTDVINEIKQALSDWTNDLGIGTNVPIIDAYIAARLYGSVSASTYTIVPDSLKMSRDGLVPTMSDIDMAFAEAPYCTPSYVSVQLMG